MYTDRERAFLEGLSGLTWANPFLPERIEWERRALGGDFVPTELVWTADADEADAAEDRPNVARLRDAAAAMVETVRARVEGGRWPDDAERGLYRDLVLYHLYAQFERGFFDRIAGPEGEAAAVDPAFALFEADVRRLDAGLELGIDAPHLYACFFQVRRAFHFVFRHILGASMAAARLRADVWRSVFTHDMRRYQRALWARMHDVPTLVTGPSGTGKELVARALGWSAYVPFDVRRRRFESDFRSGFAPLNISALSPTLVESELFGHRRGAFTGAVADRTGWFEGVGRSGTVFLDEIGDLDAGVQVKLLRVLQSRTFNRIGESEPRAFEGRIVCATHQDLEAAMRAGRFRADFYYRLCADRITTPSLATRLAEDPTELKTLALFIARRVAGPEEGAALAEETVRWVRRSLPRDYGWPGNVRELEQCVRSVMVRGAYRPAGETPGEMAALAREMTGAALSAEEVVGRYCAWVYRRTGSYVEAARVLGVDRRTVKARVEAVRGRDST